MDKKEKKQIKVLTCLPSNYSIKVHNRLTNSRFPFSPQKASANPELVACCFIAMKTVSGREAATPVTSPFISGPQAQLPSVPLSLSQNISSCILSHHEVFSHSWQPQRKAHPPECLPEFAEVDESARTTLSSKGNTLLFRQSTPVPTLSFFLVFTIVSCFGG